MFFSSAFKINKISQIPEALQNLIPENKYRSESIFLFFETLYKSLPGNSFFDFFAPQLTLIDKFEKLDQPSKELFITYIKYFFTVIPPDQLEKYADTVLVQRKSERSRI